MNSAFKYTYKTAKRIVVAIIGVTVLLIGVALLVLPGPGLLIVALGLAILAFEFAWARRWLSYVREKISQHGQAGRIKERSRGS